MILSHRTSEGVDDGFYANLAENMADRECSRVASELLEEYDANKASRAEWEDAYSNGLELLGFTYDERTQPFRGASGVTHPLLAEAATQFQAQAFNELLPASGPVRTVVMGQGNAGQVRSIAARPAVYELLYIECNGRIIRLTWIRCCFIYHWLGLRLRRLILMRRLDRAVSKFVPAENLVVPYETSDLETCPNITQVVRMSLNDLRKRQISGFYLDIDVIPAQKRVKRGIERTGRHYGYGAEPDRL